MLPFVDKESQSELFAKAQNNVEFAICLGEGFGHIFVYLKNEVGDKMLENLDKGSTTLRSLQICTTLTLLISDSFYMGKDSCNRLHV
jgi:hypothetical protein